MTSEHAAEAYVWIWLPGAEDPVVVGRLHAAGDIISFNYGRSYLERDDAIPIYLPELPLERGVIPPRGDLRIPGCILDAGPDAWGQRVVMQHLLGEGSDAADPAELGTLAYLLHSGSDRIGALDFQTSPDRYVARESGGAAIEDLMQAAEMVDEGRPLPRALDLALLHGSSIGGARPKSLIDDAGRKLIAKFSSNTDPYPVVQGEYVAMELARRSGIDAAPVEIRSVLGKNVLLVERFDRVPGTRCRWSVVSALTILELDEMMARYASYADLAEIIRERFTDARPTLRELFARITFNILIGNNDDHARNHSAFWDGSELALTPAYDICPQVRAGGEAAQAMTISREGFRVSQVAGCVKTSSHYLLSETAAREIIDHQIDTIETHWDEACEAAGMTRDQRGSFWHRQVLNPYSLEGYR